MPKISLKEFANERIKEFWQPYEIAFVDSVALRLAKIQGAYNWHTHKDEDEFFLVVEGEISIETEEETVNLKEGEGYLIKRRLRHRSKSEHPATILLIEPKKTKTKGE